METLTIIMLCLSVGLFLARYVVKSNGGVDFLCVCVSLCTLVQGLKDPSIPPENLILYILPVILIAMLTLVNLMFGDSKERF